MPNPLGLSGEPLHKGGVTTREDFLVNNKEVISEFNIYITGNSNETLITGNALKMRIFYVEN